MRGHFQKQSFRRGETASFRVTKKNDQHGVLATTQDVLQITVVKHDCVHRNVHQNARGRFQKLAFRRGETACFRFTQKKSQNGVLATTQDDPQLLVVKRCFL